MSRRRRRQRFGLVNFFFIMRGEKKEGKIRKNGGRRHFSFSLCSSLCAPALGFVDERERERNARALFLLLLLLLLRFILFYKTTPLT